MNRIRKFTVTVILLVVAIVAIGVGYFRTRPVMPVLTINALAISLNAGSATNLSIPSSITQLDGKTVAVVGDMWQPGPGAFTLTDRSQFHSFMPRPPLAQEFVNVTMKPGVSASYTDQPVQVTGVLHIKIVKDQDGAIKSVYRLDGESIALASTVAPNRWTFPLLHYRWVIGAAGLVFILLVEIAFRARRRSSIGVCPRCGYDLRATPGRCPECGTVPVIGRRHWESMMTRFEGGNEDISRKNAVTQGK